MDREQLQQKYGIIGESEAIKQALDKVLQIAGTEITVLIYGETGVGKDVTARAIHDLSPRSSENLVIVNCGAIPEGIIESELFGNEKGAYTGAHESRMGYFEQADKGTIFLDEIVDTPKNVQVKLLRVLETGEFYRVGSSKQRKVNARVIAATNKDIGKSVDNGEFREDLYYRLNTVTIYIPPLRERNEDILLIFRKFVSDFAKKYDSVFRGMSNEARQLLLSYRWPGNIRELRNVAEQLVVLEKSQYVDENVLRKYLKGRQQLGSADNLPMIFGQDEERNDNFQSSYSKDMQRIYRALLDLKSEMGDMKRMLGTFIYNSFRSGGGHRSLPAPSQTDYNEDSNQDDSREYEDSSNMAVGVNPYSDIDYDDDEQSTRNEQAENEDLNRIQLSEDQRRVIGIFGAEDLPSVEEVEKFLIKRALEKYGGNRRKAARVLGMSERTLYRKIDQYELL